MALEITAILAGTVAAATPLIFAGLGELVTQRTGVINLGVEGMMLVGAIAGFAFAAQYDASVLSALLMGGLAGMLMALIFAFFTLSLSTNQSACGLALTRSEEHTSELQSRENLVCRLLLEKKNALLS